MWGVRALLNPRFRWLAVGWLAVIVLCFRIVQLVALTDLPPYESGAHPWGFDFAAYWAAAQRLTAGEPLYSAAQLAGPFAPQGPFLFLRPPLVAIVVTPLAAAFPDAYQPANLVWAAMNALLLTLAVLLLARTEGLATSRRAAALVVAAAFAFPPTIGELVLGNVHIPLLALLAVAWWGVRRGTTGGLALAGGAVGIATVLKVFPGFVLLWFLLTRRWRAIPWAVVGALLVVALTLPIAGPSAWLDYVRVVANVGPAADTTDALAPVSWLTPVLGYDAARLLVLAVAAAVTVIATRSRSEARSYGVAVSAALLSTPALFHSYLVIMLLPIVLGWANGASRLGLGAGYLLMWGGSGGPTAGTAAALVNRAMPTLGAVLTVATLSVGRPRPRPPSEGAARAGTTEG